VGVRGDELENAHDDGKHRLTKSFLKECDIESNPFGGLLMTDRHDGGFTCQ